MSLENVSSYSSEGELIELPQWQPLVTINLLLHIGVLVPGTLFINISVFIALMKSKISNKPLKLLYGSVLLGLCVDKVLISLGVILSLPDQIRYCVCHTGILFSFLFPYVFFNVYSVVVVTCQSVMQLLIVKGRKSWGEDFKRRIVCVVLSAIVGGVWAILSVLGNVYNTSPPPHCPKFCSSLSETNTSIVRKSIDTKTIMIVIYSITTLTPAVVITIVSSVWSLIIFKSRFLQRDLNADQHLNRKMLLFPILMVILLVCTNFTSFIAAEITGEILKKANLGVYFGHWANYATNVFYFSFNTLHGLAYPIILLRLSNNIQQTWRKVLCLNTSSLRLNKVTPSSIGTGTS